ncbi:hypothetical protein, partial [Streptomyces sp. NPDC059816]|uniref:hypothetical protein n=1 Tax=Streptomyces sp. NPDC059816 TaxID=3346960 RepID=UPI00366994C1
TLLSSQGTDASFVLTPAIRLRLSSGRFPSVFQTLSGLFLYPDQLLADMRNSDLKMRKEDLKETARLHNTLVSLAGRVTTVQRA